MLRNNATLLDRAAKSRSLVNSSVSSLRRPGCLVSLELFSGDIGTGYFIMEGEMHVARNFEYSFLLAIICSAWHRLVDFKFSYILYVPLFSFQ